MILPLFYIPLATLLTIFVIGWDKKTDVVDTPSTTYGSKLLSKLFLSSAELNSFSIMVVTLLSLNINLAYSALL